jgi:predicted Fe-Mo cluster-binding NifX family protein
MFGKTCLMAASHVLPCSMSRQHDALCRLAKRSKFAKYIQPDGFFLCDVDATSRSVDRPRQVMRPKTRCESIPQWLKDMGVTMVIAGGIGAVAQKHLSDLGILVVPGQVGRDPATIAQDYLLGKAINRTNRCQPKDHRQLHCKAKRERSTK